MGEIVVTCHVTALDIMSGAVLVLRKNYRTAYMEPFLDNTDKEIHVRRSARIEQMKREKQLQEQRRRMIKKYTPYVMGAVGVIIGVIVLIVVLPKKSKDNYTHPTEMEESIDLVGDTVQDSESGTAQNIGKNDAVQESEYTNRNGAQEPVACDNTLSAASNTVQTKSATDTTQSAPAFAYTFETTDETVTIYSDKVISTNAILINENAETIIAQKGAHERISPASMTKVLTVLVTAEAITAEDLDNTFTMTQEITDYSYVNDCSSVGFLAGEVITLRDLFYGTTLHSGGDAAVGLATYVAGSHEAFVDRMNEKLEELGISESTHFTNCVGLYDENHYSTVYDMAIIMKAAMQNELCKDFLSLHTYTTIATEQHPEGITISNWFLRKIEDKDTNGEVLCAKTGYVVQSKNCAVSYEKHEDGSSYICVTAGSSSSWRCIYDHVEIYTQYIEAE